MTGSAAFSPACRMKQPPNCSRAATIPREGQAIEVRGPAPGDHVFFNGLVWTPMFEEIFLDLSRRSVAFSVLVHDIIPIERPDLVSADYTASFEKWLVVAVNTALVSA